MRSLLIIAFTSVVAAAAPPPGVTVSQPQDQAMTEGEVVVDGEPAQVFAAALDYARWTELMPDVARVEIKDKKGDDAHVTLVSPTGHRDNLHFHNTPQARLIFFEDTGNGGRADVWAEIVFAPAETQTQTRVHIRLYAKVHGVASLVVSDGAVKDQREQKIVAELTHIREYFRRRVANR